MLRCHHLLRPVYIPKRLPRFFPNRPYSSSNVTELCVPHTLSPPLRSKISTQLDPSNDCLSKLLVDGALDILLYLPKPSSSSKSRSVGSPEDHVERMFGRSNFVAAYEFLRRKDRALVNNLSFRAYARVAKHAFEIRSSTGLDHLVTDILEIYQGDVPSRIRIIQVLMALSVDFSLLSRQRVISLLTQLDSLHCLPHLSPKVIVRIAGVALDHSDGPIVELLTPHVVNAINAIPAPSGIDTMTYNPPEIIRACLILVCKSLNLDRHVALKIFQALVETNNIPAEAIYEANARSRDFNFIICSTIVRSCLHWDWRPLAVELLKDALKSATPPNQSLIDFTLDTMYMLLETPSAAEIAGCRSLMQLLLQSTNLPLPHGLVRSFYSAAQALQLGREAESIFSLTHSPPTSITHSYPVPSGRALTWLMRYLTRESMNMHLGRVLAKKVVESCEPIPLQDRPVFIALTAANGYGTQARALWERYAVGKDCEVVVGNAAMMLRLVALFGNHMKKINSKCRDLPITSSQTKGTSYQDYQRQLKDCADFAKRVVTTFQQSKQPLAHANHFDLTTLSRAYFSLGMVKAGFDTLMMVTDRKELPDLRDINVALSMLAELNPQAAPEIIERMVKRGYNPDAITFDTVLHHTVVRGDTNQINAFVRRARELGHVRVTPKAISSMLHNALKVTDGSRVSIESNLRAALSIIRSTRNPAFIRTPNIGKSGIRASLLVEDPVMAYKFWSLLVKDKTEWDDDQQVFERRRIARMIRRHHQIGQLDRERCILMLSQLGEDTRL